MNVVLKFNVTHAPKEFVDRTRSRRVGSIGPIVAIRCPIDFDRLSSRAIALLDSGWHNTYDNADDLVYTPLIQHRIATDVVESAEILIRFAEIEETSARAEKVRAKARALAHCYGPEKEEKFDGRVGTAPFSAADDATDYVNWIASWPGIVALGDEPIETGAAVWGHALLNREISEHEWRRFLAAPEQDRSNAAR